MTEPRQTQPESTLDEHDIDADDAKDLDLDREAADGVRGGRRSGDPDEGGQVYSQPK
jgi:hypothetical protein